MLGGLCPGATSGPPTHAWSPSTWRDSGLGAGAAVGGSREECSARGGDGAHWGRRLDSDRAPCRLSVFVIQVDGTLLVVPPSAVPPPGIWAELGTSPLVNRAEGRRRHFLEHYRHWFLSSSAFPRSLRRKSAAGSRAALRSSPRGKERCLRPPAGEVTRPAGSCVTSSRAAAPTRAEPGCRPSPAAAWPPPRAQLWDKGPN